jgi:YfiR/HmsC-like
MLPRSTQGRASLRTRIALLTFLLSTGVFTPAAQFSIDAVKAAYLFRFTSYVEWPASLTDAPFIIGVVGAEDVAVHLERLLTGRSVGGRQAQVRRVSSEADLQGVRILYVGERVFRSSYKLREQARSKPILLVTDNRMGLEGGGVINFIEVDRNLRFEISLEAAERNGLKIDSALLSVAARVAKKGE